MNKRLRTKISNINIVSLMMIIGLLVFSMSGCQRVNDPASGNKAINNNTTTNSNTVNVNANANSNAGANANNTVAANSSANNEDKKPNGEIESIYTDLTEGECKTIKSNEDEDSYKVSIKECPGVAGYKLQIQEYQSSKTINVLSPSGKTFYLDFNGKIKDGINELGQKAEWRVKKSNGETLPVGLITRFSFSKEGDRASEPDTSYLIVSKIDGDNACITDIVKTKNANQIARESADAAQTRPCL